MISSRGSFADVLACKQSRPRWDLSANTLSEFSERRVLEDASRVRVGFSQLVERQVTIFSSGVRDRSPQPVSECIGLFSSVENAWADYWRETDFIVLSPFDSVPLQVPTLGSKL